MRRGRICDKALASGFRMLLAKPVDPEALIAAVAALAQTSEKRRTTERGERMKAAVMKKARRSATAKAGVPKATSRTARAQPDSFPIVGIGASAGGLEAFRRLLGALPTDTGMAYVLVQHLDPHHESILAELLSEATHDGGLRGPGRRARGTEPGLRHPALQGHGPRPTAC